MLVSGKESILDGIFRICCVPQEPESPPVKHRQVARHDAVQFLSAFAKDTPANCSISLSECCYCRHNVSPPLRNANERDPTHVSCALELHLPQPGSSNRRTKAKCYRSVP